MAANLSLFDPKAQRKARTERPERIEPISEEAAPAWLHAGFAMQAISQSAAHSAAQAAPQSRASACLASRYDCARPTRAGIAFDMRA